MHFHVNPRPLTTITAALVPACLLLATDVGAQHQPYGSIAGTITLTGSPPAAETVSIHQDREACGSEQTVHKVRGENGGLMNVVVRITDVPSSSAAGFEERASAWREEQRATPATLDQSGCVFAPHIVLVTTRQQLEVLNNDGIMHNVHTKSRENRAVNKSMPKFLKKIKIRFREAEIIPVRCDVHRWMQAYIVVADHPYYAVTDEDGSFALPGIPAGVYTLEAWHPELGTKTVEVEVTQGQVSETSIAF